MGVTPTRYPGPENTDSGVVNKKTSKTKPSKVKVKSLVPPGKKVAPKDCDGSQTRDLTKVEPVRVFHISTRIAWARQNT
jgi:hypothetical protein